MKKKRIIQRYMTSSPFQRFKDKVSFVLMTYMLGGYAFVLGRDKEPWIAEFHSILFAVLWIIRYIDFRSKKEQFWLLDWCYAANLTVIYYVMVEPKNADLLRTSFLFSFGCLGTAIATFRNSLVFHKIDYVTSVGIHACPMALIWNLRHHLMEIEATLPAEQRLYVSLEEVFDL